jgi:hypothetical protein
VPVLGGQLFLWLIDGFRRLEDRVQEPCCHPDRCNPTTFLDVDADSALFRTEFRLLGGVADVDRELGGNEVRLRNMVAHVQMTAQLGQLAFAQLSGRGDMGYCAMKALHTFFIGHRKELL